MSDETVGALGRSPADTPGDGREGSLAGEALKAAGRAYEEAMRARVLGPQRGITTFFDSAILDLLEVLRRLPEGVPWEVAVQEAPLPRRQQRLLREAFDLFRGHLERYERGRYVDLAQRQASPGGEIPALVQKMSQGTEACLSWKGMPLFKSVFDFAVYPMLLSEVRPRTLFEIGSGTGASAVWLADLARMLELGTTIYSLDVIRPDLEVEGVRFLEGDCRRIESAFGPALLEEAPHPWVVIEDAHVNVEAVLEHFGRAMNRGDYLVVEDSKDKQKDLAGFCARIPGAFQVDTRFTDYFGKNCTTAYDSIFRRMVD